MSFISSSFRIEKDVKVGRRSYIKFLSINNSTWIRTLVNRF